MEAFARAAGLALAIALAASAYAQEQTGIKSILEDQKRAAAGKAQAGKDAPRAPQAAQPAGREQTGAVTKAQEAAKTASGAAPAQQGQAAGQGAGLQADPLRGRPSILEQKTRELEEAQLEAKIAAERLAKRKAEIEIERMERELKAAKTLPDDLGEALRKLEKASSTKKAPAAGKAAAGEAQAAPPPPAPLPAPPRLAGTVAMAGETIALIEHGGKVSAARAGETAGGLRVERVEQGSATVNGARLAAEARIGRLNWASEREPRPREEGAAAGALPAPPLPLPGQASPFGPAVGGGVPQR